MLYIYICIPWCTHACAGSVHELECTTLCSAGLSFRVYNKVYRPLASHYVHI